MASPSLGAGLMLQGGGGGGDQLQKVQSLIDVLSNDLPGRSLSPTQRQSTLEQLKVFGRDLNTAKPIFSVESIQILGKHAFEVNDDDKPSALESRRIIANALLLEPKTRQIFVDHGFAEKAALEFEDASTEDEFVIARVLLLITYETKADLKGLLQAQKLEGSINKALKRYAALCTGKEKSRMPSPMEEMALVEILKVFFNLANFVTDIDGLFSSSVPSLFAILSGKELPAFSLASPIKFVINALLNIDLSACMDNISPPANPTQNVAKLVEVLDKATEDRFTKLEVNEETSFDENGVPLVSLLRNIRDFAPEDIKSFLKNKLLPSEEERNQPLGKGTTLAARLLRITNSPSAPKTREHVSYLLYELSNSSPEEFIINVGYGYASGFLVSHNIPFTPSNNTSGNRPVNPITGQTLDSEPPQVDPFEGMSEEEKEQEAEKLFVLFERHITPVTALARRAWANLRPRNRLKKTGVIDVENPVATAVREGRFKEIE